MKGVETRAGLEFVQSYVKELCRLAWGVIWEFNSSSQ